MTAWTTWSGSETSAGAKHASRPSSRSCRATNSPWLPGRSRIPTRAPSRAKSAGRPQPPAPPVTSAVLPRAVCWSRSTSLGLCRCRWRVGQTLVAARLDKPYSERHICLREADDVRSEEAFHVARSISTLGTRNSAGRWMHCSVSSPLSTCPEPSPITPNPNRSCSVTAIAAPECAEVLRSGRIPPRSVLCRMHFRGLRGFAENGRPGTRRLLRIGIRRVGGDPSVHFRSGGHPGGGGRLRGDADGRLDLAPIR